MKRTAANQRAWRLHLDLLLDALDEIAECVASARAKIEAKKEVCVTKYRQQLERDLRAEDAANRSKAAKRSRRLPGAGSDGQRRTPRHISSR